MTARHQASRSETSLTPTLAAHEVNKGYVDAAIALTPEQFGAVGNGTTDDSTALQNMFNAAAGKKVYLDPTKSYKHTVVLTVSTTNVLVTGGGTLLATAEQTSAVLVTGNFVTFDNITLKVTGVTQRWNEYEKMKLRLSGTNWFTARNVTIDGSAAAGVYVGTSQNFTFDRCYIKNTRADGLYTTEVSHHGTIRHCVAENTGDDGFSIISYSSDGPIHHIVNQGCMVYGGGARGFSAMGGYDIEIVDFYVNGSTKAGLYLGSENDGYANQSKVTARGGTLINVNNDGTSQGAILVLSVGTRTVDRVDVSNVTVRDLPNTAIRIVGVQRFDTSTLNYVTMSNIDAWNSVQTYPLDLTGVVPATANVIASNVTVDGVPVNWGGASAGTLVRRDANANVTADAFIPGFTTTATAGATTTLTVDSTEVQAFTGTLAQTVVLPTTSVAAGQRYTIVNNSSGTVTVQSSGLNAIGSITGGTVYVTALVATPTTAAHWSFVVGQAIGAATSSSPNTMVRRDSQSNILADAFVPASSSTVTAAGTTVLTVDSTEVQVFTGTTTQIVTLPTTGITAGQRFTILNRSTGVVTVNSSTATLVVSLAAGASATVTAVIATPTVTADWSTQYSPIATDIATLAAAQTFAGIKTFSAAPVFNALPTGTAVSATGGTSTVALRDSGARLVAASFVPSYTSTATAGGTTTLTSGLAQTQVFTGTLNQIVTLATTSVLLGQTVTIINNSTGTLTVNSSSAALVATVTAGQILTVIANIATPTTAAHWTAYIDTTTTSTDVLSNKTLASPAFTGTPTGLTKTHVGLANVDNTADTAKPVSTLQAAAIALKADDTAVVKLTGNQTVAGNKSFTGVVDYSQITYLKETWIQPTGGAPASASFALDNNNSQVWQHTNNNTGLYAIYDQTNAKTPLSIAKNSPTNAFGITPTGNIMGQALDMTSTKITSVATPTGAADAATKGYVDGQLTRVNLSSAATLAAAASVAYMVIMTAGAAPTLPTAVGNTSLYRLKNMSGGSITPATTSGQTIDGAAPVAIINKASYTLYSDGSNWVIM